MNVYWFSAVFNFSLGVGSFGFWPVVFPFVFVFFYLKSARKFTVIFFVLGFVRAYVSVPVFENFWFEHSFILEWGRWMSAFFSEHIDGIFLNPAAGFIKGILIGDRSSILKSILLDFRAAGLSHVLAVSGYNISLLIVFVWRLCFFLSRKKRVMVSACVVVFFVCISGFSGSSVRALCMGLLSLAGLYLGRKYSVFPALCGTFLGLLLLDPSWLFDISFQLSFGATIGVLYVSPFFVERLKWVPEVCGLRENFSLTMASQIMTLPVIMYHFGVISLIAPVANILVLPLIPIFMLLGVVAVLVSLVLPILAIGIAEIMQAVMHVMFECVTFLAHLPFATV